MSMINYEKGKRIGSALRRGVDGSIIHTTNGDYPFTPEDLKGIDAVINGINGTSLINFGDFCIDTDKVVCIERLRKTNSVSKDGDGGTKGSKK